MATGLWNPTDHANDADARSAMVAHGYWLAHNEVSGSIREILSGQNAGDVVRRDHGIWFRALLAQEPSAAVRAILGHFVLVYIHPYMDGNGRIARFLMNTMFASGGYPWTVLRVERRTEYMRALDAASSRSDIVPFVRFIESSLAEGEK